MVLMIDMYHGNFGSLSPAFHTVLRSDNRFNQPDNCEVNDDDDDDDDSAHLHPESRPASSHATDAHRDCHNL
ncbi:hypothetical protein ES708_15926 [subsurface metagenome]